MRERDVIQPTETSEQAAPRFTLRVTVSAAGREDDLIIDTDEADTIADLAGVLGERSSERLLRSLWCERRELALDADSTIERAGIRWGDRLQLVPTPDEPTCVGGVPEVEVLVTGGPCSGERWLLGKGAYTLGRDASCDLRLADPSLSRKHASLEVRHGQVAITDLGSSNGIAIAGVGIVPHAPRSLGPRDDVELGRTLLRVHSLNVDHSPELVEHRGRIEFNRPPRVNPAFEPFHREVQAPPSRAGKPRLPLAASIAPLLMGIVMFVLLHTIFMLLICVLSPVMAITTYLSDRRGGKKSFSRGSVEFRASVERAIAELDRALERETEARRRESPDPTTLFERARKLEPTVWERRPGGEDFMRLRIGIADLPARSSVTIGDGGDEELRAWAEDLLSSRHLVPVVPLTIDLRRTGILGLAGQRDVTGGVARGLLLQAASLHSPGELAIAAAVSDRAIADWAWLKWLPHVSVDRVGLRKAFAVGRREAEEMLVDVRDLVADRRAQTRLLDGRPVTHTTLLLLLDEDAGIDRAIVSAGLSDARDFGIVAVWLGHETRSLPGQTGTIVEVADQRSTAEVTDVASGRSAPDVTVDGVSPDAAARAARSLAPIHDISERNRAGDIPPRISLMEVLGLSPVTSAALERRWRDWRGGLSAIVGVGTDGPFTIDLRSDGPHALIAGTTGSGKSELLRTFVAAIAATVPPDRVVFLLIDYKGGSAFAPCAGLPHVVDVVSDLDEHLAERVLDSLKAELKRRERILATHGTKDLQELQRKAPDTAPATLVIAIDEFAKLRDEVPQFVDDVVDIAQRGRSLGVHMVLAAQTLRNAFTPPIRANTNLRVALRVAETTESDDVIASPVAAMIPSGERYRGRAFARTGHSELHEFQTAYVSGRTATTSGRRLSVAPFELTGTDAASPPGEANFDSDDDNDLTALAVVASEVKARLGIASPVAPWLPPLGQKLDLELLDANDRSPDQAVVGLVDRPRSQRQDPLMIDLPAVGRVIAFGAGGAGKTTLLTTTALAMARTNPPSALRIYGLDAGSGHLAGIEALPHCGGVIRMDEEERVDRLFRELVRRIDGAARPGQPDKLVARRRTLVLLDNLDAFATIYDRPGSDSPYQNLQRVLAGGRAAGVHVMLTASRRGALPSTLAAHIGQRLVLRMPTEEELIAMGLDSKRVKGATLPPGRGFTQDTEEFQIAIPIGEHGPIPVEAAARELADQVITDMTPTSTTRISTLPLHVSLASLEAVASDHQIPLGISDTDLGPALLDLTDTHFVVVGPYRSGRSTALAAIATGTRKASPDSALFLLTPRRSPLRELDLWKATATNAEACAQAVDGLLIRLADPDASPAVVFVDDAGELNEPAISVRLERLVKASRDANLTIVAAVETSAARGIAVPWLREMRKDGYGLLLQPDLMGDGDLLATRLPRRVAAPLVPGRGFLVQRGSAALIHVAS